MEDGHLETMGLSHFGVGICELHAAVQRGAIEYMRSFLVSDTRCYQLFSGIPDALACVDVHALSLLSFGMRAPGLYSLLQDAKLVVGENELPPVRKLSQTRSAKRT